MTAEFPQPIPPMLGTLGALPTGGGWAYEYKWDGVRAIVYAQPGGVRVMSRNERDVTLSYPDIVAAVPGDRQLILDGEVVAPDRDGRPSFARLQRRMNVHQPGPDLVSGFPLAYNVFDLLSLDGKALLDEPYERRRELLTGLGLGENGGADGGGDMLRVPPNFVSDTPDRVAEDARAGGLEGVVAKRLASPYLPGRRSPDWIKAPFIRTQEVVVLGYKEGEGRRAGTVGALLVGLHRGGRLSFAGGVGTGFTDAMLHDLQDRLAPLRRATPPADDVPRRDARGALWVEPTVVGEVEYRSFTQDGRLRHSSWRGLRPDRRSEEVVAPGP
jgi:bifunctional non-homologous end joining protein LigD